MQRDLPAARNAWLKEANADPENQEREKSDFLAYANRAGRYADVHSCHHFFITSLTEIRVSDSASCFCLLSAVDMDKLRTLYGLYELCGLIAGRLFGFFWIQLVR